MQKRKKPTHAGSMPAGQSGLADEFTVKVNLGSPRGVYDLHPAFPLLAETDYGQKRAGALSAEFCRKIHRDSQDFADATKVKGAIFDPRTCMTLIAAARGAPAYALLTAAAVPFKAMLE